MTTALDLLGLVCLAAFAFLIWPPLALGVAGVAFLASSYVIEARRRGGDRR